MSNEVVELGALETLYPFQKLNENKEMSHVSEFVVINVSGLRFKTQLCGLEKFPTTLLGCREKRNRYFDPLKNEYFFDRNRPSFDAILYYYQSGGRLRRPANVPTDVFIQEIRFYELDEQAIQQYFRDEGYAEEKPQQMTSNNLKGKIWLLFEYPESSVFALILYIISQLIVLLSIVVICLKTLPQLDSSYITNEEGHIETIYNPGRYLFIIDCCCVAWFSVEFLVRFLTCPQKVNFLKSFMNIIDILVILSFPIYVFISGVKNMININIVNWRVIKFGRIFRIFKLSTHSKGLEILGKTIKAILPELCMLLVFYTMLVVFFSSAVYFAEVTHENTQFNSIPDAFWWAVITMTTVGYGDMWPFTALGKLVGSLCAITGILTIVFPIPILISKFNYFYNKEIECEKRRKLF